MMRLERLVAVVCLLGWLGSTASGQQAAAPEEALTGWQWVQDIKPAPPGDAKYIDFLVMPDVFNAARFDLADLRIRNAAGREVHYALRIRNEQNKIEERKVQEMTHSGRSPDRSDEVVLDLGPQPPATNELVVSTSGTNFRREARVEGSDRRDGDWKVLKEHAQLIQFQIGAQSLSNNHVIYPLTRLRYLRLRVYPDPGVKDDAPTVASVAVLESTRIAGEELTLPGRLGLRQAVPTESGPGSSWDIDLGGSSVPCSRLSFDIVDDDFVRDYRLEVLPDDSDPRNSPRDRRGPTEKYPGYYRDSAAMGGFVTGGVWRRRAGMAHEQMEIVFPEVRASRLRLLVTDNRNPPLNIGSVQFSGAARQVVFERGEAASGGLRLFFGNPKATAPNYDFERNLPTTLTPPPQRTQLEELVQPNPEYRPEPKPWTERWPWVIYVVLGAASAVLIVILGMLAREVMRHHDAQ
jgi:hypothetical protein